MLVADFITDFFGLKKLDTTGIKNVAEWDFLLSDLFILLLFFCMRLESNDPDPKSCAIQKQNAGIIYTP